MGMKKPPVPQNFDFNDATQIILPQNSLNKAPLKAVQLGDKNDATQIIVPRGLQKP